jgi:hypothetical protein
MQRFLRFALLSTPALWAQVAPTFQGPGILTRDAGGVGRRSGQDVDLRVFGSVMGVYDNGIIPFAVDADGRLAQPGALAGGELSFGAYGRHQFRRSVLGLDYRGDYRHYPSFSQFNSSNHALTLGYTRQMSRRTMLDLRQAAGTQTFGVAFLGMGPGSVVDQNSLLFDNRLSFLQSTGTVTHALNPRTAVSASGTGYTVRRKAAALADVNGYNLSGAIQRQVGRRQTIGAIYSHIHYDFSRAFGESDINMYAGSYRLEFARFWTFSLQAGVFRSAVQGVQRTTLDPAIAALLGVNSVPTIFYKENTLPLTEARLQRQFRRALASAFYTRTVMPGNGLFLTSRQEFYGASYSFTGLRRWSITLEASASRMDALAQTLQALNQRGGGATVTYRLASGLNLTATYLRRRQDLTGTEFRRDGSRVAIGLSFSPGEIPISFR